jgi:hypothetical protein
MARAVIRIEEIDTDTARNIVRESEVASAVGHEATAKILSTLLGVRVDFNRVPIKLNKGDSAIVFQLLTRLPEGKILSEEEIWGLGFKLYLVEVVE